MHQNCISYHTRAMPINIISDRVLDGSSSTLKTLPMRNQLVVPCNNVQSVNSKRYSSNCRKGNHGLNDL
jgi:hypothetical protein